MQNAEPLGLYCADETDGESLRVCEQMLRGAATPTRSAAPPPSRRWPRSASRTPSSPSGPARCATGVTFHDGATLDANDVVMSYVVQWDADHPLHKGRDGSFTYFSGLFGGFLNPPPPRQLTSQARSNRRASPTGGALRTSSRSIRSVADRGASQPDDAVHHPPPALQHPGAVRDRAPRLHPGPGHPGRSVHGHLRREGDAAMCAQFAVALRPRQADPRAVRRSTSGAHRPGRPRHVDPVRTAGHRDHRSSACR